MLRQYFDFKAERPEVILLMRVGDFFEAYGDDAETVARELEITLTGREDKQSASRIPMAGVPYHALERYVARLLQKGFKVAVCDQVEDPKLAKGLVKRRVTRVMTPGTVLEDALLDSKSNNYLVAAVAAKGRPSGLGVVDISTGEFLITEIDADSEITRVVDEVMRLQPAEVLLRHGMEDLADAIKGVSRAVVTFHQPAESRRTSRDHLLDHFGTTSLRGFGCDDMTSGLDAAHLLLDYVRQTHSSALGHIRTLATYGADMYMVLDTAARRNLELTHSLAEGAKSKSLVSILDRTVTPMGGRLLRRWFDQPLLSLDKIKLRQDAVAECISDGMLRGDLRAALKRVSDLERLTTRVCSGMANARDLVSLKLSLEALPDVAVALGRAPETGALAALRNVVAASPVELWERLDAALAPEPPITLREGGLIRDGFNAELDELRELRSGGKAYIARIEEEERTRTGIKNLKVGFNNVFGYYIEISKANGHIDVPSEYHRKQTTANAERYVTPTLKEYEAQVLGAQDRISDLEYRLFTELREDVAERYAAPLLRIAKALGRLDVYSGLAEVALQHRYVRPEIHEEEWIEISGGRHPVVETLQTGTMFVPNDTSINTEDSRLHIITGPNSAGKSTYLRQVALIVLMAQVGSFVPADSASIGIVDRIFTRIGAHDDLASGQSTFMVEMNETANILNNATTRSLVILDEVGRGTSTFDGLALAWAVAEYLHTVGAKTLFATHYHHLNELEKLLPGAKNYRVAVKEKADHIVWLRKIMPGGTDKSYGIQVAKLAGLPQPVLERAADVLKTLESLNKGGDIGSGPRATAGRLASETRRMQLTLFEAEQHPVVELIAGLDLSTLSPIEALTKLYEMQKLIG